MAAQSLVSVRFEKTETPARFEPMPSKKPADRNKASVPKHPNASSSRASAKQKTVRNAHTTTSRNVDSERWLLKVSSASDSKRPKHQQDSSPCQAKNTQTEPIRKNKASVPKHPNASLCQAKNRSKRGFRTMAAQSLVSVRFEKTETPARFEPMPSKKHANRRLHIKNKASVPKQPNASMSRAHAKQKTRRKNASRDFWNP